MTAEGKTEGKTVNGFEILAELKWKMDSKHSRPSVSAESNRLGEACRALQLALSDLVKGKYGIPALHRKILETEKKSAGVTIFLGSVVKETYAGYPASALLFGFGVKHRRPDQGRFGPFREAGIRVLPLDFLVAGTSQDELQARAATQVGQDGVWRACEASSRQGVASVAALDRLACFLFFSTSRFLFLISRFLFLISLCLYPFSKEKNSLGLLES